MIHSPLRHDTPTLRYILTDDPIELGQRMARMDEQEEALVNIQVDGVTSLWHCI